MDTPLPAASPAPPPRPTRKQRELAEREERLLDAAERLLLEHGYLGLTMDRIADVTEYAKGTVYQHFASKEDVLAALSARLASSKRELFLRAATFAGLTRERCAAVGVAYGLWARRDPDRIRLCAVVGHSSLREKCSAERLRALEESEDACTRVLLGLAEEAVAEGELVLPAGVAPGHVVHGLWAVSYGAHQITQLGADLSRLGLDDPLAALDRHCQALLDGYGWRPLEAEWDWEQTRARIRAEVFAPEFAELERRSAP